MKIENLSQKAIEFFKKHGKKIICTGIVTGSLAVPFDEAITEEHDVDSSTIQSKQEHVIERKDSLAMMSKDEFSETLNHQAYRGNSNGVVFDTDIHDVDEIIEVESPVERNDKEERIQGHIYMKDEETPKSSHSEPILSEIKKVASEADFIIRVGNATRHFHNLTSFFGHSSNIGWVLKEAKVESTLDASLEYVSFTITTPWKKTSNYSVSTQAPMGPKKEYQPGDVREYQRTTYNVRPTGNMNFEYFKDSKGNIDYGKLLDYFIEGDKEQIFDIVGKNEVIEVDEQEEKNLNTSDYSMAIDDTDFEITLRIKSDRDINIEKIVTVVGIACFLVLASAYLRACWRNYQRYGVFGVK